MSILQYGLTAIEQSECKWRVSINKNIENIYTVTEIAAVVNTKAETVHTHVDYFPLPELLGASDISPVLGALVSDVVFSSTYGPCLVDRVTSELFKISVDSGAVIITGTGEFAGITQNGIDVDSDNMVAVYNEVINGEVI